MPYLTPSQVETFHRDGFLVVPNYLNQAEINLLRSKITQVIDDFDMASISIFTTNDQERTSDKYFIDSGDKVRCFFEEEAFDEEGALNKPKEVSINKIGHALHDVDADFYEISYKKDLAEIAQDIGMKDPLMVQSQYIFKQPHIGGKVNAHQDSTFIYTDPPSCMGFWMALEDATMENGCLMGIPGSHKADFGTRRFVRNSDGKTTTFIGGEQEEWDLSKMVPMEAQAGSLVLLHGTCVHASNENRSPNSRHSYIIHMVEKEAHWPEDNWLQRPEANPFRRLNAVIDSK